jgi:hypothetical protein
MHLIIKNKNTYFTLFLTHDIELSLTHPNRIMIKIDIIILFITNNFSFIIFILEKIKQITSIETIKHFRTNTSTIIKMC